MYVIHAFLFTIHSVIDLSAHNRTGARSGRHERTRASDGHIVCVRESNARQHANNEGCLGLIQCTHTPSFLVDSPPCLGFGGCVAGAVMCSIDCVYYYYFYLQ